MASVIATSSAHARIARLSLKQVWLALLIASTGFDVLSLRSGDNSVRVSYLLYGLLFLTLIRHMRVPKIQSLLIGLFCVAAFAGMMVVGPSLHSVLYIAWVLFSFLIVYPLFYYFGREHRDDFLAATVLASRAQIVIGGILVATHLQHRAALLYYEPSYFAYGLIPYVAITVWRLFTADRRKSYPDLFLLLIALIETGSATLLVAAVVVWLVASIINGLKLRAVVGVLASIVGFGLVLYIYSQLSDDLLARTVRQIVSSPNAAETLIERGGNRIPRMLAATYIFRLHPLWGVGIGQYRNVSNQVNLSSFAQGNADLSAQNNEAINIYVELLATTGIPTACIFFVFLIRSVALRRVRDLDDGQKSIMIALVSMLLMLNFEANYLRPYLWMLLGLYAGMVQPQSNAIRPVRVIDPAPILTKAGGMLVSSGPRSG